MPFVQPAFPTAVSRMWIGISIPCATLFQNSHGIRRLGSAAVDLAYVACGRIDAFFEYNLNAWDVAGGALIVQEAGGNVTDFSGGGNFVFGKELIATNKLVHAEFLESILHPPE
jgi:myo-inositol-1(or 4)-monophosphatase